MPCNCASKNDENNINDNVQNKLSNAQNTSTETEILVDASLDENGNIKHVVRNNKEIQSMMQRLNRIEGQVRGVKKMLEEERYCVDILTQVASIQAALNGFNKQLLANHIKSCVCDDIRAGKDEAVDELCELLKKLMK